MNAERTYCNTAYCNTGSCSSAYTRKLVALAARALACVPLSLIALTPAAGAEDLLRAPWRAWEAGVFPTIGPNSMATGDLDRDGDSDVLLGLFFFGGPGIAVVKGEPDGSFGALQTYDIGNPRSVGDVALSDVDGDGDLDALATVPDAGFGSRILAVWRNDGSGRYGTPSLYLAGDAPTGLVVADFNGDGFDDVVTADAGFPGLGNTVSLLVHNGLTGANAGFLPPQSSFSGNAPDVVRAGDFDGDGDLDLAVGRETGNSGTHGVAVLLNEDGAGSFGDPAFYDMASPQSTRTSALAVDDVDRDGELDLIGSGSSSVGVRHGTGAGTFGSLVVLPLTDFSFTANALTTADLNGDDYPDIVAATPTGRSLDGFHVFLSDGDGSYAPDSYYEAAKQTFDVALVNVEGDGDLDVVTAANDSSVVTVHRNDGSGVFYVPRRFVHGTLTSGFDSADIDADGDLDLASSDSAVNVLRNRGDGTFDPRFVVPMPINPLEVKLRDMNGDGAPDILVSADLSSDFAVALNRGDGTFMPGVRTAMGGSQGGSVDAFDLDGDGIPDVAVADPGPVPAIRLARGLGNGTSFQLRPELDFGSMPFGLGGGDFDHDGHMDLATSANAFGFAVFRGRGDFTFEPMLQTGERPLDFALTDVDADGEIDVVYDAGQLTSFTEWVGVMRGYGDGTFRFPEEYPGPIGLESPFRISADVDAADMNGDGLPDLVLTSNAPNDVAIFTANPDGSLNPMQRYGAGYQATHSAIGDFDGDGIVNVATSISLPPGGFEDAVVLLTGLGGDTGGLQLSIEGSCPGAMTISATGATPGRPVRFLRATGTGNAVWPGGSCAGTQLGLDEPVRPLRSVAADAGGVASFTLTAPPAACGVILIQAMDAANCATSGVGAL